MANLISSVYYRMILHSTHSFWARLQVFLLAVLVLLLPYTWCYFETSLEIFSLLNCTHIYYYCCTLSISLRATLTLPLAHTVSSQFDLVLSMLPWLQITAIFTKKQEGDDENYDNFTIISEKANKKFRVQKSQYFYTIIFCTFLSMLDLVNVKISWVEAFQIELKLSKSSIVSLESTPNTRK